VAERTQRIVAIGKKQTSTTPNGDNRSLLALDIRAQKFGFVIFKEQTELLTFGTRKYGGTKRSLIHAVLKRIGLLLDFYEPSVVVIRQISARSPAASRQLGQIIKTVRMEARRRNVDTHILNSDGVKKFFAKSGLATKHEIASTLAEWYKDIAWKLPNKKKAWQSERHNLVIFDAVATGVAFFGLKDLVEKSDGE
jgi:Holliday junction resolvasome RuvABC endonuclease subunit